MTEFATNVLSYGDNLDILRRYLPDASVDLIYLDPPFNSNRESNVIFKDEPGNPTDAGRVGPIKYRAIGALRARAPTRRATRAGQRSRGRSVR